jgi:hypothetical protein
MIRKIMLAGCCALFAMPFIGCGGSSSSSSSVLTTSQALAATSDLFLAMTSTPLGHSTVAPMEMRRAEAEAIRNAHLNGNQSAPLIGITPQAGERAQGTTTVIPTYTYACPLGGTIVVNGSYTGTTTSSSISIVETITNCQDTGFTLNGSPDVAITDSYNNSGTVTTDSSTIVGGFTVGSAVCSINVSVNTTMNDTTYAGSETINGSVCGISLSGTYSY